MNISKKFDNLQSIPTDWKANTLGNLGNFKKGSGIRNEQLRLKGYPCVTYGEIYTKYNISVRQFKSYIDLDTTKEAKEISKNDVLFAGSGETAEEIGKTIVYLGEEKAFAGGDIVIFTPNNEISGSYVSIFMNSEFGLYQKTRMGQGYSVVHIYPDELKALSIIYPSRVVQNKLVSISEMFDSAVEKVKRLIKAKEVYKKAFIEKQLNYKKNKSIKWKKVMLGNIGEFKTSSVDKKINSNEKIVKLLNYMDVYRNNFITKDIPFKLTSVNERELQTFKVEIGDILFTPSSETPDDIGHSAVVLDNIKDLVHSYHLVKFRIANNVEIDLKFRGYFLNVNYILNDFATKACGATRFTISLKDFQNTNVFIPESIEAQGRMAEIFISFDKEINLLKKKLELLKLQKKGLMEQLLTGKLRVKTKGEK